MANSGHLAYTTIVVVIHQLLVVVMPGSVQSIVELRSHLVRNPLGHRVEFTCTACLVDLSSLVKGSHVVLQSSLVQGEANFTPVYQVGNIFTLDP